MRIIVNGRELAVEEPLTVAELLELLELAGAACAVEVNRRLVPRKLHASAPLQEGDAVEIVTLVGGG